MKKSNIKIEIYPELIENLTHNEINPRQISKKKFEELKKSMRDFPEMRELREVIVDEDLKIWAGHQRILALQSLGEETVIVKKVSGLTEKQKRELMYKDNNSSGEYDYDILANFWDEDELSDWGFDDFNFEEKEDTESAKKDKEPKIMKCPNCGFELEV